MKLKHKNCITLFLKRRAECSPFLFSILLFLRDASSDLANTMFAQISILFKENSKLSVGSLMSMFALIFTFLLNTKGILDLALNNSNTFVNIIVLTVVLFIGVLCTFFVYTNFSLKKEKLSEQKIVSEEESTKTASVKKKKKRLFIALLISSCIMVLVSVFLIVGIRQMRYAELHYIALTDELNPEECRKFKADIEKMIQTDDIGFDANQVKIIERTPEVHQCILKPAYFLGSSCSEKFDQLSSYPALREISNISLHIAPPSSATSIPNRIDYFSGGNETLKRILTKLNALYDKCANLIH